MIVQSRLLPFYGAKDMRQFILNNIGIIGFLAGVVTGLPFGMFVAICLIRRKEDE